MWIKLPRFKDFDRSARPAAALLWPACQMLGHPTYTVVSKRFGPGHHGELGEQVADVCHCGAVYENERTLTPGAD